MLRAAMGIAVARRRPAPNADIHRQRTPMAPFLASFNGECD